MAKEESKDWRDVVFGIVDTKDGPRIVMTFYEPKTLLRPDSARALAGAMIALSEICDRLPVETGGKPEQ